MRKIFVDQYGSIKWRKIFSVIGVSLLVVILGIAGKVYFDIHSAMGNITKHVDIEQLRKEKLDTKAGEPMNVLLIGTDDNKLDRDKSDGYVSRSDTLIVISMNPEAKTSKILSIPRDTYTNIEGRPTAEKINHAYAYGGAELTIDTVQKYLHIPIDYYVVVNMSGLEELIDAIGGIEVTSPLTFNYRGTQFHEGETRHVNGVKAMNFARMRYEDPEGEVGRQNRQKLVIKAIIDKFIGEDLISHYQELLKVLQKNIQTNVNLGEILTLYRTYVPALDSITSIQFDKMDELYVDGIFYFDIAPESRLKVANEIRRQTNLPRIALADLGEDVSFEGRASKSLQIVFNQYPSGVSEKEKKEILDSQNQVQDYRQSEHYVPAGPPAVDYSYTQPVQSTTPNYGANTPAVESSAGQSDAAATPGTRNPSSSGEQGTPSQGQADNNLSPSTPAVSPVPEAPVAPSTPATPAAPAIDYTGPASPAE